MSLSMRNIPSEPTPDQCDANAPLGHGWFAIWYPQMGGYSGKAAFFVDGLDSCVEIVVWHDGEFPFADGDVGGWDDKPKRPVELHHCDMEQFRRFAEQVEAVQATL